MNDISTRVQKLAGKLVIVEVKSGASYAGILWRKGVEDRIILSKFSWKSKDGAWSCSKTNRNRSFDLSKVRNVYLYLTDCDMRDTEDIRWSQIPPLHPVAEWKNTKTFDNRYNKDLKKILDFLFRKDLPEQMSFSIHGSLYHFKNERERQQWALGFQKCFDWFVW